MNRYLKIICPMLLFTLTACSGASAINDGFETSNKIDGKNVVVFYTPDLTMDFLSRQFDYAPSNEIVSGPPRPDMTAGERLSASLDALYKEVCDITDMPLYSLQVYVKVCRNYRHLAGIYKEIYKEELKAKRAFYHYESNTVYVSADSFRPSIVGHELGRAIISHYFIVPSPMRVQEALGLYVEFSIEKAMDRRRSKQAVY